MKRIKKSIVLLFSVSLLFLCGCASNYKDITLHKTTTFWSGTPTMSLNLPYPEPMSFEVPSANWMAIKTKKKENLFARAEMAEADKDSYVRLSIEGQTEPLFISIENGSGVDFNQSDSLVLMGLFDHYKARTQAENAEKPIQYGETKFERQNGDVYAWMVTSNGSYSIAYAVLKTKTKTYYTVEVDQKNRTTDIEKTLLDIVRSHKSY